MIIDFDNKYIDELNILLEDKYIISFNNIFNKKYCYLIGNKIVGFIDYSIYYELVELNYIVVDKSFRKKGIASILIKYMIDEAKKQNCRNITLEVNQFNTKAIALYNKFNFVQVAIRKNYYKGADALLLELKLEGE